MKTKLIILITFLVTITAVAQQGINYKAIVKDNLGNVVANQSIDVQFAILEGATTVYQENHTVNTDANGYIILIIGEGTTSDVFTDIDWGVNDHFLNVQIDTGSGLLDLGTIQFKAVPYALYAANVSGLEAIDELDGIGWRLVGRDPANHSFIGLNAIDFSYSNSESNTRGASGRYSTTMGLNTEASGSQSLAIGNQTMALGNSSVAMGFQTTASEDFSTAMGIQTTASGNSSTAMGFQATASGISSTAIGRFIIADDDSSTVVGTYNENSISTSSLFQVGNGTFEIRSNAFNVDSDGTITAPSFDIVEITDPKALITKEYLEANGSTATGLEAIDEGNGIGYRLSGSNPTYYGNIGDRAVDLSYGGDSGYDAGQGAIGTGSVALGEYTTANVGSVAMGYNSTASGQYATAMGNVTTASGLFSTTAGFYTVASALYATALGNTTIADDQNTTVLGKFNDNTLATNTLLQVGNGSNNDNRSNAFVVDSEGIITAPSFDMSEITDNKALITKEFADANYLGGGSGTNPTGLEALDEGNGIGWRMVGRDPANYGNIGDNAVDLSHSGITSATNGATGAYSTAIGRNTTASGDHSVAMLLNSIASGENSIAMGYLTTASGVGSIAIGYQTIADVNGSTVVGRYNDNTISTSTLFQVGNGTSSGRSNAFTVLNNGTITAPSFDISEITDDKALITKEYLDANGASGLEALDEGNGIGWRLKARDPANYGNIGLRSVDFSYSDSPSSIFGAIGDYALAMGYFSSASGNGSISLGSFSRATGNNAKAMGYDVEATGVSSTALGILTEASGDYATALGYGTIASGDTSLAMGRNTIALAYTATSMGSLTIADDLYTTVVGVQNDNTTSTSTLFQVGNGTSSGRSNAFTVFQSGNALLAGTLTQNSDRRLKEDIEDINYGLNEILALNPKTYHWKNRNQDYKSLGLIAQEVQPIINEIVHVAEDKDQTLSVSYIELIPVLVKAIQEQQVIIDQQVQTIQNQDQASTDQAKVLQTLLDRVEALEKEPLRSHVKLVKN